MSVPVSGEHARGPSWITCPNCGGYGQGAGDESGWDGTSMHTPPCPVCDGRGEVPTCTNVHDSCHGDPEVDECTCARRTRDLMAAAVDEREEPEP